MLSVLEEFSPQEREVQWKGTELYYLMVGTNKRYAMFIKERLNVSKMSILPQIIYRFNAIPMNIPKSWFLNVYSQGLLRNKVGREAFALINL